MKHFFESKERFSVTQMAQWIGSSSRSEKTVSSASSLEHAQPFEISCFHNSKYKNQLSQTKAGVVIVSEDFVHLLPKTSEPLMTESPYRALGMILSKLYAPTYVVEDQRHLAHIHPTAIIGDNCSIGANTIIKAGAIIGHNCVIGSLVTIGEHVEIGNFAHIDDAVTISHAIIGDHLYVKPGARIGQPGFGFHMDKDGHFDVPQLGNVTIGHNVQIGANTTIDRGSQSNTVIGNGVRIDNLVQVAHNVTVGDHSVLAAQCGIAGSSSLGKFVIAAGQVGIAGHLNIGNYVKIAAQSGLIRDVQDGATIAGSPAVPVRDWHKQTLFLAKSIRGEKK